MNAHVRQLAIVLFVAILASACGSGEPISVDSGQSITGEDIGPNDCPFPEAQINRPAPDLVALITDSERRWIRVGSVEGISEDRLTEVEREYMVSWNTSESRMAAQMGVPFDSRIPALVVEDAADGPSGEHRHRLLTGRSRLAAARIALEAGQEVWFSLETVNEVPVSNRALALGTDGSPTFLGWCGELAMAYHWDDFVWKLGEHGTAGLPGSTAGSLLRAMLEDPDAEALKAWNAGTRSEEVAWIDLPPGERAMHDAPGEIVKSSRSLALTLTLETQPRDASSWLLCTATRFARTGCISADLLSPERPFLLSVLVPAGEDGVLEAWVSRDDGEAGSIIRYSLLEVSYGRSSESINVRLNISSFSDLTERDASELVSVDVS